MKTRIPLARAGNTLNLYRFRDGVWCALILPPYSTRYNLGRGYARTPMEAARVAVKQARGEQ